MTYEKVSKPKAERSDLVTNATISFEEKFPELKDLKFFTKMYCHIGDIEQHCLSKQRVKEAIEKCKFENVNGAILLNVNTLLKELGLEE